MNSWGYCPCCKCMSCYQKGEENRKEIAAAGGPAKHLAAEAMKLRDKFFGGKEEKHEDL